MKNLLIFLQNIHKINRQFRKYYVTPQALTELKAINSEITKINNFKYFKQEIDTDDIFDVIKNKRNSQILENSDVFLNTLNLVNNYLLDLSKSDFFKTIHQQCDDFQINFENSEDEYITIELYNCDDVFKLIEIIESKNYQGVDFCEALVNTTLIVNFS